MRKKILVAIILNVVIISLTLGILSYITVNESIERSLQGRLAFAGVVANHIEVFLQGNLNRLYDISLSGKIDLADRNREAAKKALETAYRYSLFSDGVFLLDKFGNEILSYPLRDSYSENLTYIESVRQVLREGKPVVSNVFTIEPIKKQVIFMLVPLRDREGTLIGAAGGMISPTSPIINQLLQTVKFEKNSYIEIIDRNEVVLASDQQARVLKSHKHGPSLDSLMRESREGIWESDHEPGKTAGSRERELVVFAPLKIAPWGVIIGQPAKEIFAPSLKLRRTFILLIAVFILTSIFFAMGASKGIVRPLEGLIAAAGRIGEGNLSKPVGDLGSNEILALSRSFDSMRQKLAESLEEIQKHTIELEHRVAERTEQISRSQQRVAVLLKKVISSQEEERKRIARELHDEVLQDINAFLINLDILRMTPGKVSAEKIDSMKSIVVKTIDNIHNVIQNMRPTILDDFGMEAAIRWLMDKHLIGKGIEYRLDMGENGSTRFSPVVEITLFRTIQESIVNIARHSKATFVYVEFMADGNSVSVTVKDNGSGFDVQKIMGQVTEGGRGLGLLGMNERIALVEGEFGISSTPGEGTTITIKVPLHSLGG